MRFMIGFAVAATLAVSAAHAEGPGEVAGLAPFRAVELHYDGIVDIRPGPVQQVTLVAGDRWRDTFTVSDGRLTIHGCKDCGDGFRVVVVTPSVEGLSVVQGGTIIVDSGFPRQPGLSLKVERGGLIQASKLVADRVAAQAIDAGRIDTAPIIELSSRTTGLGAVVHAGDPKITRAADR